jgi:CRP-like cAMP-binding protein
MARLRAVPIFAPLAAPALEGLARSVVPVHAAAGTTVIEQGDAGDRFYVVVDGELAVSTGRTLRRGDSFGEIALLRDVPRTASVRAVTPVRLDALDKETFLTAVTGHPASRRAADDVVQALLH